MIIPNIIYFIISAVLIIISATYLVKSLTKISHFLKISEFNAAFMIMALATAIPELFVGLSSALSKVPSLSLGNALGSSILHFTLIIGILILVGKGIKIKSANMNKEMYFIIASILLMIILFIIGNSLSRTDGIILLAFFGFSYYKITKKRKQYLKVFRNKRIEKYHLKKQILIFIISIIILFLSAKFAVKFSSLIAFELNLPKIIIGLFLISISTTLPELAFGLRAIKLNHKEMVLGDLAGGVLVNICLIIGIVTIIQPIKTALVPFLISSLFLLFSSVLLLKFMKSRKRLQVKEGIGLIFFYVLFIIIELFSKSYY